MQPDVFALILTMPIDHIVAKCPGLSGTASPRIWVTVPVDNTYVPEFSKFLPTLMQTYHGGPKEDSEGLLEVAIL